MSVSRRGDERRRRVLYSAGIAENEDKTAASRRAALLLREARNPAAAYGARVHRRLRGRWFSLVPVKRVTAATIIGLLMSLSLGLSIMHYGAVNWPFLVNHPEVARPFRLDRPDSFGSWLTTLLLALCAGVSLLIYQLRRYRIDDYKGHYRLWRLVILICVMASLNSLSQLVDWSGALLDASIGRRVALSGTDWVRIVVFVGGAVLALRLIAEVRRCRLSLIAMVIGWAFLTAPVASRWSILRVESLGMWMLVTSAPLLGVTTLFVSLGVYLRMLYREVRRIEDHASWSERLRNLSQNWRSRSGDEDRTEENEATSKRAGRSEPAAENETVRKEKKVTQTETSAPKEKRRWFGLRSVAPVNKAESPNDNAAVVAPPANPPKPTTPQPIPKSNATVTSASATTPLQVKPNPGNAQEDTSESDEIQPKPKRSWFGFGRSVKVTETKNVAGAAKNTKAVATSPPAKGSAAQVSGDDDDDGIDSGDDDGDYSGLSKAERRRLRKQQRRGRAA